jgi:aryl-alcohol dehydrogenase-like predicted oxidoreductase
MLGKRDDVAIVSKSGVGWHENRRVNMSNDVPQTQKMLEDSLRRLGRERIEIYMIHWPDAKVDIRHPLEYLLRQQEKGKIKHLGLCNTNLEDWQKATSMTRIDVLQSQVNVFEKPAQDLVQAAALKNVPMMGWGTFDKGIIAGTVTKNRNFESCDARSWAPWWKNSNKDQKIALMEKVLPILEKHGHNGIEFGLKYSLDNCEMPLIGAKSVKQLQQVFAAFANLPSEELMQELIQLKEQLLPATAN